VRLIVLPGRRFDAYLLARGGVRRPAAGTEAADGADGARRGVRLRRGGPATPPIIRRQGLQGDGAGDHADRSVVAWFFVALAAVRGGAMARGIRLGGGRGWVLWAFGVVSAILIRLRPSRRRLVTVSASTSNRSIPITRNLKLNGSQHDDHRSRRTRVLPGGAPADPPRRIRSGRAPMPN
jgi:hypothetical protein